MGKNLFKKNFTPFLILLVVAVGFIGLERFSLIDSLKGGLQNITVPVQLSLQRSFGSISSSFAVFSNVKSMRDKTASLEQENALLKAENAKLKRLQEENSLLRKQLKVGQQKEGSLLLANAIGFSPFSTKKLLLMDKGSENGVKDGDLLVIGSNLLGVIVEVGPKISSARILSDPDSKIPAETENGTKGILTGEFQASVSLKNVLIGDRLNVGDIVFTSGELGFPKDFVLGEVKEVKKTDQDLFQEALVTPFIDFSKIKQAFILLRKQ